MGRKEGGGKWKGIAAAVLVFLVLFALVGGVCSLVGFALLKFLGFTYDSAGWLAAFFVLYLVIGFAVSFVTEALPKALRTVLGFGELVYQLIYAVVDIAAEILVVMLVDTMLPGVSVPMRTVLFFGVLMYLLERIISILTGVDEDGDEGPHGGAGNDSEQSKALKKRLEAKLEAKRKERSDG